MPAVPEMQAGGGGRRPLAPTVLIPGKPPDRRAHVPRGTRCTRGLEVTRVPPAARTPFLAGATTSGKLCRSWSAGDQGQLERVPGRPVQVVAVLDGPVGV